MKTKNSIYSLMSLAILFTFTSCVKDDLDTWVSIEVIKKEVVKDAVDPTKDVTKVTFNVSGNAETYVVYTGDAGHEFAKSYLVLTQGQKIDQEEYLLTQADLDAWTLVLQSELTILDNNNTLSPVTMANVDLPTILVKLKEIVGKSYNLPGATYALLDIMPDFVTFNNCEDFIIGVTTTSKPAHFTNNSDKPLTPVGGFSTGVALDRNNLTYSYIFKTAGPYTVTVLGTKIGQKNYSGSGYIDDRTSSAGEYNYGRNTATVVVP